MQFHVGQKVVCINDRWANGRRRGKGHETMVKAGVIYTVREVVPGEPRGYKDGGGLRVREIVNRPDLYHPPAGPRFCEAFFCGKRFFPVQTTNIDVFLAMPARVRLTWAEDVEAEAWIKAFTGKGAGQ